MEEAKGGRGVEVQVTAGPPEPEGELEAPPADEVPRGPEKISFLKRATTRLRRSIVRTRSDTHPAFNPEHFYRDSMLGGDVASDAAKATQACSLVQLPGFRLRVLRPSWQNAGCRLLDSLPWNLFVLAITLFAVFAPDIAIITSAPDSASDWINGFLCGIMGVFALETVLGLLCREELPLLELVLDVLSNASILWGITWFTDAVGIKTDGVTSDAARAVRIIRLVRVVSVLELMGWQYKQWRAKRNGRQDAPPDQADQLAPTNIGRKIGVLTTLQVATVAVAITVGTSLLVGADVDSGSLEGLQAFAAALAAQVAAGATATQLQPTINSMLTFAEDELGDKQVPMILQITGADWSETVTWVEQNGGWTQRSSDRKDISAGDGSVQLAVDVSAANHYRAMYNMLLAGMVIAVLLVFLVTLNYTIYKMLVQPLDRIFHIIRTNASQVIQALGTQEDQLAADASGPRGSRKDDVGINTIEAAVQKMSRILEQYTSAGGVGVNTVKKMAETVDQSTKEWLATMVAGPASAEVAAASPNAGLTKQASELRGSPSSTPQRNSAASQGTAGGAGCKTFGRRPSERPQRLSRLGRMSETNTPAVAAAAAAGAAAAGAAAAAGPGQRPRPSRVSTLAMFQESRRNTEESTQLAGSPSFEFAGSPGGGSPVPMLGAGSPTAQAASALSPAATPRTGGTSTVPAKLQLHSAVSDAAALAAAARLARLPTHAGDALAGAMAGDALTEVQKQLLAAVDVDYLHSFSFDALSMPAQLLPAYIVSMFLELDLAHFGCADAMLHATAGAKEPVGFTDVATLWRFVDAVAGIYRQVKYHNFYHCTDVTHTTFMFIKRVSHKVALTPLEKFALMVAAVAHDMDHPGVNNAFLVNCKDPLAVTYNDSSVLENRHVACLYSMLPSRPDIDIFDRLEPAQWREMRKMVIGAVLATDMVHHFPMVGKLEVFYELHGSNIAAHHRALRHGLPRDGLPRLFDSAEERQLLLNLLLHCADISNPIKPTLIAEKWSERVLGEFFEQGDRERAAGLPISPMCDRDKTSRAGSQINFIEFVVAPLYAQVFKILPELGEALDNLIANRHFWQDQLLLEMAAAPGGLQAEEVAKADKRLRDFQDKYKDIVVRRRNQLERLATQSQIAFAPLAHQVSLPVGGGGGTPLPPLLHHRPSSLFALVQQQAGGQGSPDVPDRGRRQSGNAQGAGLLGKLGKLARTGSRERCGSGTPGSSTWAGDGSARTSATSLGDAQAVLADLQHRQTSSFSAAAGGAANGGGSSSPPPRKGSGNRIAPEDAV